MMIDGHSHVHIPLLVILVDSNKATGSGDVTVSVLRQHRALSSEKKELLRRDYARAMSDETVISGDKCVTAENGHTKPCKRVGMDPCTLKNLVSASKEALGSRQTAAAVDGFKRTCSVK
jgi:hypothetical protein